jgi:hypothetical protein
MEAFQVKKIHQRNANEKKKIQRRLAAALKRRDNRKPMIGGQRTKYGVSRRVRATKYGGIGVIKDMLHKLDFVTKVNDHLKLFKIHKPYHESDHVLNIPFNILTGGRTLDDIEHKRNDGAYLDAIGAESIPDPTTAGDFTRRFEKQDIINLMDVANMTREKVWRQQPEDFFQEARIDGDGSIVKTYGETKQGMSLSFKGIWGYHPLLISLANTQEPLFIVNRSGNRPSHEDAAQYYDRAAELCLRAGFRKVLFRGDTDFSQVSYLDGWDAKGYGFIFGYDARANLVASASQLADGEYSELVRRADLVLPENQRARPVRYKQRVVEERGYQDIELLSEDVSEFNYRPHHCKKDYRIVVVRKNLMIKKGGEPLFDDVRYFFYITNRHDLTSEEVVREACQRCNQENLIEQLQNGVNALRAPVNTLEANWAFMVMAALAWSFKAWSALLTPVEARSRTRHLQEKAQLLRMEFRQWATNMIEIPAQVVKRSRQIRINLLAWNHWQPAFWRLALAME